MSLSSTIKNPKYREIFRSVLPDKSLFTTSDGSLPFSRRNGIRRSAPNPQRIGTAFDYVLRAQVARWLGDPPTAVQHGLATKGLNGLRDVFSLTMTAMDEDDDQFVSNVREMYRSSHAVWVAYIEGEDVKPVSLETACWFFAGLESLARSFRALSMGFSKRETLVDGPTPEQHEDLSHLLALLEPHRTVFEGTTKRVYNPTFRHASDFVGGADADIIINSTLIEIKTSPDAGFKWQEVAQLVGYCLLAAMDGELWPLTRLAIYRARYSRFEFLDVRKLIESVDMTGAATQLLESIMPMPRGGMRKHKKQLKENAMRNLSP